MFDLFAAAFEFTARVPRSVTSHQSKMKVLGLMSNIDSESGSNIDLPVRVAEVFEYLADHPLQVEGDGCFPLL